MTAAMAPSDDEEPPRDIDGGVVGPILICLLAALILLVIYTLIGLVTR